MAHYNTRQIIENIERVMDAEARAAELAPAEGAPAVARFQERRLEDPQRSLFRRLEKDSLKQMRVHAAVDRPPEGARLGFVKKLLGRILRMVSAPQSVYNHNNIQALQSVAYELDQLRERVRALEDGPARPLGLATGGGVELTRLSSYLQQHLGHMQEHIGLITRNMKETSTALTQLIDHMGAMSTRFSQLNTRQTGVQTEIAAARVDVGRLWTELGLVYESIDSRASDLWRGLDERDLQLQLNTEATQKLHTQAGALDTAMKELKARMLVLTEQLNIHQDLIENMQEQVHAAGSGAPGARRAALPLQGQKQAPGAAPAGSEPAPAESHLLGAPAEPGAASGNDRVARMQLDLAYLRFQKQFRGDENELRTRQRSYLARVEEHLPARAEGRAPAVLDVACGDGIFVELCQENGWKALGVDLNEAMVKQAKARSLPIERGDALAFLESAPPQSFDLISGFQFIEHLSPAELMRLLKGAYRALRPGGLILLETINPHTLKSLHWFHLDLTHARLIFPEMLSILAETAGYQIVEWKGINTVAERDRLVPTGSEVERENVRRLNDFLFGAQDYYLIARRSGRAEEA